MVIEVGQLRSSVKRIVDEQVRIVQKCVVYNTSMVSKCLFDA